MPTYNNPAFAQAASNLAQLFAPPSGADAAGWAGATAKREEAQRLADFYAQSTQLDRDAYDRQGAALGIFNPTQGFGARDMTDATNRYGIDTGAATSRSNNAADNSRALEDRRMQEAAAMSRLGVTDATARYNNAADNSRALQTNRLDNNTKFLSDMYGSQAQGAVRPGVPGGIAGMYGLPNVDLPSVAGAPKPLSETEFDAQQKARLHGNGQLTDDMILDGILGERSPVQTVGPGGTPTYMSPGAAVRTGAQPFINKGAEAKPTNGMAVLPDGRRVPAMQSPEGHWIAAQTGERLPPDVQIFNTPSPQGTADEVGVSKPVNSGIEKQLIDISVAKNTAVKLRDLIAQAPSSQGAIGMLRGAAQNFVQTGGELGQYFGGSVAEVNQAIANGAADAGLAGAFDPNIPAIEMMANLLAFQYAKTTTGERLSNEMLRNTKAALGLDGLLTNQASSMARLNQAIKLIEDQERMLDKARTEGVRSIASPAPAGVPPAGMPSAAPAPQGAPASVERWQRGPDGRPARVQ